MTTATTPTKVARSGSPEWLAARSTGIGASEVAAAAGLSPYMTPLELYHRKRGELPPIEDNDAMRMGRLLEPVVKSEFCRVAEVTFVDPEPAMYRHARHDPIIATPDAIIDETTLFEAKTASWRMKGSWGEEDTDDVPPHYLCQCQQQMAVMGAELVHLAVLFDGAELKTFRVLRNDELISLLIAAALELWQRIQNGDPPEPTWTHPSTPKLIREIHGSIQDTRIELTAEEAELWSEYEALGAKQREIKERRDVLQEMIRHVLKRGNHFAGLLPDGRMVRRKLIESHVAAHTRRFESLIAVKADAGRIVPRETVIGSEA